MRTICRILFATALIVGLSGQSRAGFMLTQAARDAGLTLSTFALGFPVDPDEGNGPAGPLGIAFRGGPGGGVFVTDAPGNIRLFPTDTDGQDASSVPPVQNAGRNNAVGLARIGGNIYMTQNLLGQVVQLNPDGTFNQFIASAATPTGIVVDPRDNHLLVASQSTGTILDIDPSTRAVVTFLSNVPSPDGLSISADGKTLYVAAGGQHILGYDTTTKDNIFASGAINGIDGTVLGVGPLAGNIFGNTNFGQFVEVNLTTGVQTLLGTGGTRGDFVALDPDDGSLFITQTDRVLRIRGFAAVPEPSSLVLLATGLLGLLGLSNATGSRRHSDLSFGSHS